MIFLDTACPIRASFNAREGRYLVIKIMEDKNGGN
jgi:hypothetical protein